MNTMIRVFSVVAAFCTSTAVLSPRMDAWCSYDIFRAEEKIDPVGTEESFMRKASGGICFDKYRFSDIHQDNTSRQSVG
jgi:hypothetical protein